MLAMCFYILLNTAWLNSYNIPNAHLAYYESNKEGLDLLRPISFIINQ